MTKKTLKSELFSRACEDGRSASLAWMTIGSPYIVELAGKAGFDAVLIDCQHGLADKSALINGLTAARAAGLCGFVRVGEQNSGAIGTALDAGARGVVCPMINNAAEAQSLVRAVKYPPLGTRSYGPYGGKLTKDGDYFDGANGWTIACAQIETVEAVENLEDILGVEGLDMVLVGPNDLAISMSGGASRDIRQPALLASLDKILEACGKHNVVAAIFANDVSFAKPLIEKNWDLVVVGTDASIITNGFCDVVALTKVD